MTESLLELRFRIQEVIYCLRLSELRLGKRKLGIIKLQKGAASYLI